MVLFGIQLSIMFLCLHFPYFVPRFSPVALDSLYVRCFQVLGQKILMLRYREVYQLYLDGCENFSWVISTVAKTFSEITIRKEEH